MTSPAPTAIEGRLIGPTHPPYVIAELSGNHNGDIERALSLIEAAKAAGADAVKLQTYTPDTITLDADGAGFVAQSGLWAGRKLYDLYRAASTPWEWHEDLFAKARELGITAFSTPFDPTAVDLLERLGAPAYKIASFELIDIPLIRLVAQTGKPMIMSTGIANLAEIEEAITAARDAGCTQLVVLHCVSGYPTPPEEMNLRTLPHLGKTFGVIPGLSDHTLGTAVSVAAVALGASVIEKHITLARADGGVDSAFSLEPGELSTLCRECHTAWAALGRVDYSRKPSEAQAVRSRRSLYVVQDMAAGEIFTNETVRSIRPGFGLPPKHLPDVLGRRSRQAIARATPLAWTLID